MSDLAMLILMLLLLWYFNREVEHDREYRYGRPIEEFYRWKDFERWKEQMDKIDFANFGKKRLPLGEQKGGKSRMKIEIYQLAAGEPGLFAGSAFGLKEECRWQDGKVKQAGYHKVYECNRDDAITLEDLFYEFNINLPNDFCGHSLSVSDVVLLGDKLYFCDSFGWKESKWT